MTSTKILLHLATTTGIVLLFSAEPAWAQGSPASTAPATAASTSMNLADQKMIKEMAQANLAEISIGKLAQSKSQNSEVKTFAQKMIDDHTLALQDLQQIATKKGVTLPTEPDKAHQAIVEKLQHLSGASFDQRYIAQGGLADHRQIHALLKRVQENSSDPELKAAAARTLGVVDDHLAAAQQVHGGKASSTGSSGTTGSSATGSASSRKGSSASGSGGSSSSSPGASSSGTTGSGASSGAMPGQR